MKLKTYGEFLSALEDKGWIERLEILDDAAHSPISQGDFFALLDAELEIFVAEQTEEGEIEHGNPKDVRDVPLCHLGRNGRR